MRWPDDFLNHVVCGNCLDIMKHMPDNCVDTVITDPPYGLSFMGKDWDHGIPGVRFWCEILRVAKPGAICLAFGGTRTYHRLVCVIEDAGWEIRDCIQWIYGSGFPKSLDISKAIDRQRNDYTLHVTKWVNAAVKRSGRTYAEILHYFGFNEGSGQIGHWTALSQGAQPVVPNWEQWQQLKSLLGFSDEMDVEVWQLNGRKGKPSDNWDKREMIGEKASGLSGGTGNTVGKFTDSRNERGLIDITAPYTDAAKLWDGWGTALKPAYEPICVAMKPLDGTFAQNAVKHGVAGLNIDGGRVPTNGETPQGSGKGSKHSRFGQVASSHGNDGNITPPQGRWPANVIHDGSEEVVGRFPMTQSGKMIAGQRRKASQSKGGYHDNFPDEATAIDTYGDNGSAARFFYCAKASKAERGENNNHPTVKPLALIQYLCRLTATPTGGIILDPFLGSGTTAVAAKELGRQFIGIEIEEESCRIAETRLQARELFAAEANSA